MDKKEMANNPWKEKPHLLEDIYTFEDALLVGCMLIELIKNADRVKIACLAQLVNVIAPIMTVAGGKVWKQTIYYPYLHASLYGRGIALQPIVNSPDYSCEGFMHVPYIESVAVYDEEHGIVTIFAVNRNLENSIEFLVDCRSFEECSVLEHIVLESEDLKATNSETHEKVIPQKKFQSNVEGHFIKTNLSKASWNVIRLKV
jgi:alpha-N-arabinofuranosidase